MRLLDRYLLRELLVPFSYCLFGFFIFWLSFDLFAELSEFQSLKLSTRDVATYYAAKAPEIMVMAMPIAFLLALLYALTSHARYNELTAIRAAGVSLARMSIPYFAVGLALGLVVFATNELWVPRTGEVADRILSRQRSARTSSELRNREIKQGFYNVRARRHWFIEEYNSATFEMTRPHVIWRVRDGSRREIVAERGAWVQGVWVFTNLFFLTYSTNATDPPLEQRQLDRVAMPEFWETPDLIKSEFKFNRLNALSIRAKKGVQLSLSEIIEYRRLHPDQRNKSPLINTKFHERLATPWTCLVVVLIALPFGAAPGRRNVFVGVASSIVICFAYFVVQQLAVALGTGGRIPAWIAAWTPNALFALVGLILCWRIR